MTTVSLPLRSIAPLGASWGVGNKLVVFSSTRTQQNAPSSNTSNLVQVTWETSLYDPIFRKLVNESSQTFFALQKLSEEENVISNQSLLRISRQYRSVIRDCLELVQKSITEDDATDMNEERSGKLYQQSELLYKLELIWNLVEILSLEKPTAGIILPQLLQWISLHFPQADEKTRRILEENPENPETHHEYWDALTLFITQARIQQAQNLLRLHSEFDTNGESNAFSSLDSLIGKMPIFSPQVSIPDFNFVWKHWQNEVLAKLNEGLFASYPELAQLASLMSGLEDAFNNFATKCETWYQWMSARLLFTSPDVKTYDLPFHAEKAINKFGGLSAMTSLDSILLAAMESDVSQLMNELCSSLDNFWFPAHLLDLLHHADELDNMQDQEALGDQLQPGPGLREFLLLDYATCLMTHSSMWQVGALYLDHCPTQGRFRLECLLSRMPLTGERKANKVIALASRRGMTAVVASTCKVMGMKALRNERIGTAMAWALRSQDVHFTTYLADKLLHSYCESGSFSSGDLLDNLGESMILSDRLAFLAKYKEFYKLCQQTDFKAAANLLHSLMWSRLAPKYFWITLLIDAIPFLDGSEVFLSSDQTYEIMHCLQELVNDASLPKKQRVVLEEHESHIRLLLSHNLAKSLLNEGDESQALQ